MQHNKWLRVKIAILSSTGSVWFDTRLGLAKQLGNATIEVDVVKPAAFELGGAKDAILSDIRCAS